MSALRIEIPERMMPFLRDRRRHKIARGGRGGGKSWAVARLLAIRGYAEPIRWLCCREVQRSIRESSLRILADQIRALGLESHYDIQRDVIRGANGTEFIFAGLRDHTADSIKSYEGCDGAWIEEAHSVSEHSANTLIPTIRKPGSELWWTYNPDQPTDFVHALAESRDPNVLVVDIGWQDNPWFPGVLDLERRRLMALNDDLYRHIWGGACRTAAGILFKRVWFSRFDLGAEPAQLNRYMASDYAGGQDPDKPDSKPDNTEHGCWGIDCNGELWALDWWTGEGEDPAVWVQALAAMIRRNKPLAAFEESGPILRTTNGAITTALLQAKAYTQRVPLASAGSKVSRALGFAMLASAGKVHIPNTEWGERLINQLCSFTGQDGRRDDMVDVCSLVARGIDQMAQAQPPSPPAPPPPEPFTDAWFAQRDGAHSRTDAERARYYR